MYLRKHNRYLLLDYLKSTYDEEQLRALSLGLPDGFAKNLCEQAARHVEQMRLKQELQTQTNHE